MAKCTIVFDCDLRQFDGNPFHAETPFGKPVVTACGDLAERCDALEAMVEYLEHGGTDLESFKDSLNI